MTIESIIDEIISVEGRSYTNHPSDKGGPTKYGITQRTLSAYMGRPVSAEAVMALTEDTARAIYLRRYVIDPGFDAINAVSPRIGHEIVDSGVNVGVGRVSEWLQRSLNALNRQGRDYADLNVDGDVGPATIAALKRLLAVRGKEGETALLRALNSLQGEHYIRIAEGRAANEDFVFGWLINRVVI